jgi:hypothetical protein
MRLSGWRKTAPAEESMTVQVMAMLEPVLADFGAEADPVCWVIWGDDARVRYSILVPTIAGLVVAAVRTASQGGTPRAAARLVRWPKLAVSELNLESSGGRRIVAVQVEMLVLKGVDEEADRICEFVRDLIAEADDRHPRQAPIAYVQATAEEGWVTDAPAAATHEPVESPVESPVVAAAGSAAPAASVKGPPKRAAAAKRVAVPTAAAQPVAAPEVATQPVGAPRASAGKAIPAPKHKPARAAGPAVTARSAEPVVAPPAAMNTGLIRLPAPAAPAAAPAAKARAAREESELELDRSEWIPPHPVAEALPHKPARPRPWRP